MKKVRINLLKGVKSWSFFIYDSAESAFYLKELSDDEPFDEEYRRQVSVHRSDVVEVEWLGSEWVYHEELGRSDKYDKVRLARLIRRGSGVGSMGYIEVYSGWVLGDVINWACLPNPTSLVKVTPIKGRMKHKLDFSRIFQDQLEQEENEQTLPIILN